MKIIFRADGNSKTGLGHLYRLFSLVEMVKASYEFVFITKASSTQEIIPIDYPKVFISDSIIDKEEPNWLADRFEPKNHLIIADGYQFISSYQKAIKEKGFKLIYIDDLADEYMYADVVINHSPYMANYHYKRESYTKLALGAKYALLRPSFIEEARQKPRTITKIVSAFVCFGGADPYNLTYKAASALLEFNNITTINIVLGAAYSFTDVLELRKQNPKRIHIYRNLSEKELLNVMKNCDMAIAPASTILYEICCIKMPVISGYYVDNQINLFRGFRDLELLHGGGDFRKKDKEDFKNLITIFLQSNHVLNYINNQSKFFDGKNFNRLLGLVNTVGTSLREAKLEDVELIFEWSNEKQTRINSFNSKPITIKEHKLWFENKISDPNAILLIMMVNQVSAGIIRFDMTGDYSTIGITVSSDFRGQGLASEFLKLSSKYYFNLYNKPISAFIKKENIASQRAFIKAGYYLFEESSINGISSYTYKLEKLNVKG